MISAVLITKEKAYPQRVLQRLDTGFFDEIIIKTESANVFERYSQALEAKHDIIYVQDDDCFVNYQELFKHYNGQLTNAITPQHHRFYSEMKPGGATLVGWGCFFPKSMLNFDRYLNKFGKDEHLMREADRIFTFLNQPFNTIVMPHIDLPQTQDRMSLQGNHYKSMAEAIEKIQGI